MKKTLALLGALALSLPVVAQLNVGVGAKTDVGTKVEVDRNKIGADVKPRVDAGVEADTRGDTRIDTQVDTNAQARGRAESRSEKAKQRRQEGDARLGARSRTEAEGSVSR